MGFLLFLNKISKPLNIIQSRLELSEKAEIAQLVERQFRKSRDRLISLPSIKRVAKISDTSMELHVPGSSPSFRMGSTG